MTVPAKTEELHRVIRFIREKLAAGDCGEETLRQLRLAVEEVFVNIVSYAYYPGEGEAEVCCRLLQDPPRAVIRIQDRGTPFDPLDREEADTSKAALLAREGGLGIMLVKNLMDDVQYAFKGGKNVLTMTKRL